MKTFKLKSLLAAGILCLCLAPIAVITPGCALFGTVAEGHDKLIVNAERTAKLSFAMVDGFLEYEEANRPIVPPQMTRTADELRTQFPPAYTAFRNATKLYKFNRTADNKANLNTALVPVQTMLESASGYLPPPEQKKAELKAASFTTIP